MEQRDGDGLRDDALSHEYHEAFAETVIHFHHFAELVIKDFLRAEHPLLADHTANHHVLFHKLLKGESLTEKDEKNLKSAEFSEASKRLYQLIDTNRIDRRIHFIAEHHKFLETLTNFRNRLLHRGTVIMRYDATDEFVGGYVLPFVLKVVELEEYKKLDRFWRPKPLYCGVDFIQEIVDSCKRGDHSRPKIALLKELGRAAYENPIDESGFGELLGVPHRRHAELIANAARGRKGDIRQCAVCGVNCVQIHYDHEDQGFDGDGVPILGPPFPFEARCLNCTFEIDVELFDSNMFGLAIPNYLVDPAPAA